jgi:hypothetical protein
MRSQSDQAAYDRGYEAGLAAGRKQKEKPLTLDQIKQMSEAEIIKRKPEVDAVLAGGQS